jgi:hypothetical protein
MHLVRKILTMVWEFVTFNVQTMRKQKDLAPLAANTSYRGSADGELYILFTGASLAGKDLRWLKGRDVMAANLAFWHENYRDIEIKHYSLLETWSYRTFFFLAFVLDMALSRRKTGTRPTVWLSTTARHYIDTPSLYNDFNTAELLGGVDLRYIRNNGDFVAEQQVRGDFSQPCNVAQGTMTFCIFLGIYLGYKKIYLLGSDYAKSPMLVGHLYDNVCNETSVAKMNEIAGFDICSQVDTRARAMNDYALANGVDIVNVVDTGSVSRVYRSETYVEVSGE